MAPFNDFFDILNERTANITKKRELQSGIYAIMGIFAIITTLILTSIILKFISKNINMLTKELTKVSESEGDLTQRININSKNEIGDMARGFNRFVENITHIISGVAEHSTNTQQIAERLMSTSDLSLTSANSVQNAVNEIAQGACNQAGETASALSTIEHINQMIGEMSIVINNLFERMQEITKIKEEGNESLTEMLQINQESQQSAANVNNTILKTNDSTHQIAKASEMIQSISDQTNLLALNAAIEAARAGEAGKGFSVVAEEIRKLAEQSAGFTEEIRRVIDELQKKSEEAVQTIEKAEIIVEKRNEKLVETQEKFQEISNAVEESNSIAISLAESSNMIKKKNKEVVGVVEKLSHIAEENAAGSEEVLSSVEEQFEYIQNIADASAKLHSISSNLHQEISKFTY